MAAVGAVVAMVPGTAVGEDGNERVVPKIEGLDGPRGIDVGPPRRLIYTEADGSITETVLRGDGEGTTPLGTVPATGLAPAISQYDASGAHILTTAGEPGSSARLYWWSRESGDITEVANIADYQATDPDPFNQEGDPTESNPYGVATLADGSALVADAANNDLLRVWPDGETITVARVMPRVVLVGEEFEDVEGYPPPGTPINAEAVVTSVTIGADGAYYIGELRGFPSTRDTSEIWRIEPDAENAVCNPETPDVGDCTRYADGFTSIVDLAGEPDGELYVLELVRQGWLQWEEGLTEPIGAIYRLPPGGGHPDQLANGRLILPGGVDVSRKGRPFVSVPMFGDGAIVRVR